MYVEMMEDGLWYVKYPDGSKADSQGYRSQGWATRSMRSLREALRPR